MKRGVPPKRKTPLPRPTKPLKRTALPPRKTVLKSSSTIKRTQALNIRAHLQDGSLTSPRKPIAQRSKTSAKGRAAEGRGEFVRKMIERARGQCEMGTQIWEGGFRDHRCQRAASEVHEPLTRARGGRTDDPLNSYATCRACHDWAHEHPAEATSLGLLRNSWDNGQPPIPGGDDEQEDDGP